MKKVDKEKEKKFYALLQNELGIYYNFSEIENKTLEDFDLTKPEVDLFLNKLERAYDVKIYEGEVDLKISFAELVQILQRNYRSLESLEEKIAS